MITRKKHILFWGTIVIWNIGGRVVAQTPSSVPAFHDPHWQLVWNDEFNAGFDNNKWIKAHYCDHGGELQLYLEQNVSVSGGNLVIKVEKVNITCPSPPPAPSSYACGICEPGVHAWRSGWIESKANFDVQYGYIESRVKLPDGKGFFPAFWTWRGNGPTSNETEIDIRAYPY